MRTGDLVTDQDFMMVGTRYSPLELLLRGMFFDMGMGLITDSKSGLSPLVMSMTPSWMSISVNKY